MKSIAVCAFLYFLCPTAVLAQSIEGVWTADVVVIGGGDDAGRHTTDIQPGLLFFSAPYYSVMFVNVWEPRVAYDSDSPDDVRMAAWRAFTANAGRYEIDGSTVTFTPSVAKNPSTMTDNSYSAELEWDGDAFWLTFDRNDGAGQNRVHYIRKED